MSEKASVILSGTVERIIKSPFLNDPDKAQINVERADHLYQDVRIENTLTDENGGEVSLKVGAPVEIKMEAEATSTVAIRDESAARTALPQC